jgi:hypothetical protein
MSSSEEVLNVHARPFVHVLLFRCPTCGKPLTAAVASERLDRENVAVRVFRLPCPCDWSGVASGLTANQHWVEPWEQALGQTAGG